jgi:ribosomal protein S18 acetylase RimI-like enzyme
MITHARLEAYLRRAAALTHEVEEFGPFTLYFDPHDALRFFNYAKPSRPFLPGENASLTDDALSHLIAAFEARGRLPRFEFTEEYAPGLPAILRRAGFGEEARQSFMICEAGSFRPVDPPPGMVIRGLTPVSPIEELRAYVAVQRQGFGEDDAATAGEDEAEQLRPQLGRGGRQDAVAWWGDQPVGAAGCTALLDGLSELVGVATPPRFRRRGIGAAVAAAAVAAQFAAGAEAVILTAEDESAGRIYERIGFRPFGVSLAYSTES